MRRGPVQNAVYTGVNNATTAPEIHGTGWLQKHVGAARSLLAAGRIIRIVDELSGVHRGILASDLPDGMDAGELIALPWSELTDRPGQVLDAVRDGMSFVLTTRGGAVVCYLTLWDDRVMAAGPQGYTTREAAGDGGRWREVSRTFAAPEHTVAVRT